MENEHQNNAQASNNSPYLVPGSIVLAGMIIAVSVFYTNGTGSDGVAKNDGNQKAAVEEAVDYGEVLQIRENDFMLGNPSAPVTIIEYSDFQCPFCGKFYSSVLSSLKEKYIKTGEVKFVYRDFAFLGQESVSAAMAAKCAGDQGKFWEYHDYLFEHQNGENGGAFSVQNLKSFAGIVGLEAASFGECLDSGKYEDLVKKSTEEASSIGVNGTPTSFVSGQQIVGAQPISQFEALIKNGLEK